MKDINTIGSGENIKRKAFRFFNIMYIIALLSIACVTGLSQLFIQKHLNNQMEDAHIINISGRQRMLSQKITKQILIRFANIQESTSIPEIKKDISVFQRNQKDIYALSKTAFPSGFKDIKSRFNELNKLEKNFVGFAQKLISASIKPTQVNLTELLTLETQFLELMDKTVYELERASSSKVQDIKRLEYLLLGLVLTILLIEVVFIFQPVARRIRKVMNQFVTSEKRATDSAEKLNKVNTELQNIIRQNRDINFALDKATAIIRTDEWGNILYTNDKYSKITKYDSHELIGKKLFFNNQGGPDSIIYEHLNTKEIKNNVWQGEISDQAKDGTNFWVDVTMMPIEDNTGSLYQYLVICNNITQRKEAEAALRQLNEKKFKKQKDAQKLISNAIITGQENERKRMAIEIHDGVGQQLTALKFQTEALRPVNEKQQKSVDFMKELIYDTIKEVRRISSNILPSALVDFGLQPAIKDLINNLNKSTSTQINYVHDLNLEDRLTREIEVTLYRIAQEALNNAIKHSGSKIIEVSLKNTEESLTLTIKDNGRGFNPELLTEVTNRKSGNGLTNMMERAEMIGAKLAIQALPKLGVIVSITLPITRKTNE